MNRYYLQVLGATAPISEPVVEADYFSTTTNSSTSSGYYAFFVGSDLVASYPIERTIIKRIDRNYED
jgi:hypothetical protein